jgi:protein phosphatase 1 regulatory subunit 11
MSSNNEITSDLIHQQAFLPSVADSSQVHRESGINTTVAARGGAGTDLRTTGSVTTTMTITAVPTTTVETTPSHDGEVLRLTLRPRPSVRWDENVTDNEGMGRKSSKRCCIFHKEREFGESSTDSSAEEDDNNNDDDASDNENDIDNNNSNNDSKPKAVSGHRKRKIARPKTKGDIVPDYQRFHA